MRKVERIQPDGSVKVFTVKRLGDGHSAKVANERHPGDEREGV
jgi:hypothetical protein